MVGVVCQLLGSASGLSGQDISWKATDARTRRVLIKGGDSHIHGPVSPLNRVKTSVNTPNNFKERNKCLQL